MLNKENMTPYKHLAFTKLVRTLPDTIDDVAARLMIIMELFINNNKSL